MRKNLFIYVILIALFGAFMSCNRDSGFTGSSEEGFDVRIPDSDAAPCLSCPTLTNFSFSYLDENASGIGGGHFLIGIGIDNDFTQFGGVPAKIDLFDYLIEEDEFKHLNDDPFFKMFLDQLNVPEDTLESLYPVASYSRFAESKLESGFYEDEDKFCTDNFDDGLFEFLDLPVRANTSGLNIAPDSVTICKLAADICAMRSIVDLMTFSLFPYELVDQTAEDLYNKDNFKYTNPFAVLKFDNRNLVNNVDFDPEEGVETNLNLGDCPIFRSNDRTVPTEFTLAYDRSTGELFVDAKWADEKPLLKVNVILAVEEFSFTGIRVSRKVESSNAFRNGTTIELPELSEILDDEGEVIVFLQISSQEGSKSEDTVNSLIFGLTNGSCN